MADKSTPPAPLKPKLSLKRETLRTVSSALLDAVVGGGDTTGSYEDTPIADHRTVSSDTLATTGDGPTTG